MEAAGIEPASCSEPTVEHSCDCVTCSHPCAARALHPSGSACQRVSSLDADLRALIAAWKDLPVTIRKAILAPVSSQR
jgi:hypothetical protein